MKINVTVDLEDFWLDEETIDEALKKEIKQKVIKSIWDKVEKKIETQIEMVVKEDVEKQYARKIQGFISDFLVNGKLKGYGSSEVSIEEWIKEQFERNSGWNSPNDQIKKLAEKFGKELKDQYDLMFASQIVVKLHEQGLLKDDVAKLLIDNK